VPRPIPVSQVSMSTVPDTRLFRFLFVGRIRQIPSSDGSENLNLSAKRSSRSRTFQVTVEYIREYGALPTKACHLLIKYPFRTECFRDLYQLASPSRPIPASVAISRLYFLH
jgi:hypothetical protein